MSKDTAIFRVTINGPAQAREQLYKSLKDLASEAERSGVDVRVERVPDEDRDYDTEFRSGP